MIEIERSVETYFTRKVTQTGALVWKFTSPGTAGVPDRLIVRNGTSYFVELKRPGEKPRPLQKQRARQIRDHGGLVYCISTRAQVDHFVEDLRQGRTPKETDYDNI